MYIFDTLSHLYAGNKNVLRSLQQLDRATVGTTIITKIEMLRGRIDYLLKADTGSSLRRAQQLSCRTEELLLQTQIIPITDKSIVEFDRLSTSLKYRKIRRAALTIASIVLSNRATLITRNLRHFKQFPRLSVVNWID